MSESVAAAGCLVRGARAEGRTEPLDARRVLQLVLAAIWLLDGMLQFQPFMFGKGFPQMLAATAQGNPAFIARPITWDAALMTRHLALLNAVFAIIQVAIGLGVAWRPAIRYALAASVAWSLGVWWFGEGLGGVLSGTAAPLTGAPGAVILYALLAVLLWPAARHRDAPFVAGRAVSRDIARLLWLIVWTSLAFFALAPASRAPGAASGAFSAMTDGQPGWLAGLDRHLASALAGRGLLVAVLLAAVLVMVAAGVYFPVPAARAAVVLAVVVAAFIWLAEGLGGVFAGAATDPNSGPLLALLAVAYWPGPAQGPMPHQPARGTMSCIRSCIRWGSHTMSRARTSNHAPEITSFRGLCISSDGALRLQHGRKGNV